jgi:hypothetical protein
MDVSGQFLVPAALPPWKEPLVPIWYRRLGGPRSRSGRGGEEKDSKPLPGLEPSDLPSRNLAPYHWAIPALIFRLIMFYTS